ncbi:autotransporter assembly complex family protein [Tropicimonas sp. IMCC6043]|uniref:autotransporter assembly complex protein TamA n=1 Tax=Tropicimonas sp. IMCC6043 TaxID=2510645 RepID=UPI00101E1AEB|nr:autotransporter assembly complex family protein [Tropicimonas sp. IMCC6043]RYH08514.1 outer membrane protein assembly factor [Tropicimonas sp. IMCC6043]
MKTLRPSLLRLGTAALLATASLPADALESVTLTVPGGDPALLKRLENASMVKQAQKEDRTDTEDLLATARAEYKRMISTLYGLGYYGGVVSVKVDGREAADISPLSPPKTIRSIDISVQPGPEFRFSEASVTPLAPGTELPKEYAPGEIAEASVIGKAAVAATGAWRDIGHAKADLAAEDITANHANSTIRSRLTLDPGPKLRFGPLIVTGNERMRTDRIRAIAGLPTGETYSPQELNDAGERLRRSRVFRSVSLREATEIGPDDQIAIEATLIEQKPRRFGIGAEVSTQEGGVINAFWMHRNLFGGAENLRFDLDIENIGTTAPDNGVDYLFSALFVRPATFIPDIDALLLASVEHVDDPGYIANIAEIGGGIAWHYSDSLEFQAGLGFRASSVEDAFGERDYTMLTLPLGLVWDKRNDEFDPSKGFYLGADLTPFAGISNMQDGALFELDARKYLGFGEERNTVLAGRMQWGSLFGPEIPEAPEDYLFFAGGGGSVRGQPFQSLGAGFFDDTIFGGRSYVALSGELRSYVSGNIGVVGFVDAAYVGAEEFYDGSGSWMSGAGVGLRYKTGFGPIRVDFATPVEGGPEDADPLQIYIGIGQAF